MKRTYAYKKKVLRTAARIFDFVGTLFLQSNGQTKSLGRKILVVRLDQLGDIIQTLPFFERLRSVVPDADIHFLTTTVGDQLNQITKSADHAFVWNCRWFDRTRKPHMSVWAIKKWIRDQKFDTAFDLRGDVRLVCLLKWAGVKNIVGYGATGGGFLLDREVSWIPGKHAVDKNLALLPAADGEATAPRIPFENRASSPIKTIAVHPDAGTRAKKWSSTHFEETIRRLLDAKCNVVLVGLDQSLGEKMAAPFSGRVQNMMGKTNLTELIRLLAGCDGLLTNDSGPAHVMAALGKPVWIVWAGTADPAVWAPRGPRVKVLSHSVPCAPCSSSECFVPGHPCLSNIKPEQVVSMVRAS